MVATLLMSVLLVAVMAGGWWGNGFVRSAAANTWTQTDWSGGLDGGAVAAHPASQAGHATFASAVNASGVASAGNVTLEPSDFTFTDDGTLTSTGAATGGGFGNGATSSTTVSGVGAGASAALTRSSVPANTFESAIPAVPGAVGVGGAMLNNGDGDIYLLQGDTTTGFFKYSIAGNSWTTLATVPGAVGVGAKMIRNGTDNDIYVLRGGITTDFYRYSISDNAWTALSGTPIAIRDGSSMIRNGADNEIYVVRGGNGNGFYRYSISGNSWTTLTAVPGFVGSGGTLVRNGADNDIYLLHGGSGTAFSRYSISGNSWTSLTAVPGGVGAGGTMLRSGASDDIYVLRGEATADFYRYSILGNSWTSLTSTPAAVVTSAGVMMRNGADDDIYLLRGNGTEFYRYSIAGNSWTTLAAAPSSGGLGSAMVRSGADDKIYVAQGGTTNGFFVYSVSGNSWNGSGVSALSVPAGVGAGSNLLRSEDEDVVYVLRGGTTTDFYRHTISTNTWTALASAPSTAGTNGGNLLRNGTDNDIYWLQGGNNATLFRYSISGNSWTTLAAIPGAVSLGTMVRDGNSDHIYVLRANSSTGFFRYSIAGNSWTTLAVTPASISEGQLSIQGDDVYLLQVGGTGFYRYSISGNSWTTLAVVPAAVGSGGTMLRNGADNDIYVLRGNSSANFYRYSISGNSWTTLTSTPSSVGSNGGMVRRGGDDDIYVLRGNNSSIFFKYSVAGNSWTTIAAVPGVIGNGRAIIAPGIEDQIYILQGGSSTNLWRYTINTVTHPASGTLTSAVIDTAGAASFGNASWSVTLPLSTTLTVATRTGGVAVPDGTWSPWSAELSTSAGSPVASPAARYLQYRVTFGTAKTTVSPTLNSITFAYDAYPSSGTLVSSAYDSSFSDNAIEELSWIEDAALPAGTTLTVSLRTAATSGGLVGAWSDFTAATPNCQKAAGVVTCPLAAMPLDLLTGGNDQFLQYKLAFASTDPGATPTVGEVSVGFGASAGGLREGTITVTSVVVNDDGGTMAASDFSLFVNGRVVSAGTANRFPAPSNAYTVTILPVSGYSQAFSGGCDVNGKLNLTPGENKVCVITSDDLPASSGSSLPLPAEAEVPVAPEEKVPVEEEGAEAGGVAEVVGEPFVPAAATAAATSVDDDKHLHGISLAFSGCHSGTLITLEDEAARIPGEDLRLYYCGRDGKRYVFPDAATYLSWFPDPVTPFRLSRKDMAAIPIGGAVTSRPGVQLLRLPYSSSVYVVAAGGTLRRVPDDATAEALYGPGWQDAVIVLSEALLTNYHFGSALPRAGA
jgi:hypothetical protein